MLEEPQQKRNFLNNTFGYHDTFPNVQQELKLTKYLFAAVIK
jgi:hypothetical protein